MVPTDELTARTPSRVEGRLIASLVMGLLSLAGLLFPPAGALGIAALVISTLERNRIAHSGGVLKGRAIAWIASGLGVIGILMSLVLPGFVLYVWIYAIFHSGQMPGLTP